MKPIMTERLQLRPFREDDFAGVHRYAACEENTRYMKLGPNSASDTRAYIQGIIAKTQAQPLTEAHFVVVAQDSGDLIGACCVIIEGDRGELGWIFHQDYWGQGYGTEAARALLTFGFDELQLRRIIATCNTENIGSHRIMEKIGMRREATRRESRPAPKGSAQCYGDEYEYAVLAWEWQRRANLISYC